MAGVTTYKITEDIFEESFALYALHSSLEEHSLAYKLNRSLKILLKRSAEDLDLTENSRFPVFEWKDELAEREWVLLGNTSNFESDQGSVGLFGAEKTTAVDYLLPEYKEVDYFLKVIDSSSSFSADILKSLLSIPEIVTAYSVDTDQLKSKSNLIF